MEQPPVELVDQQSPLGQQDFFQPEPPAQPVQPAFSAAPQQVEERPAQPVEQTAQPQPFEEMAQETIDMEAFARQVTDGDKEQQEDMITGDDVIRKMDDLFKF
jgi:hypothetical protein